MLRRTFLLLSRQQRLQKFLLRSSSAKRVAARFVAGDTLPQALEVVRDLNGRSMLATLDHLGENVVTAAQAENSRDAYLGVLHAIVRENLKSTISVKLTQLGMDLSEKVCRANLSALVAYAEKIGDFVEVDMEGSQYTDQTIRIVTDLREKYTAIGAVIQAYLYRSEQDIRLLVEHGVSVRLCKGAYKEPADKAFQVKATVNANYIKLMKLLLASRLYHRIATHDTKMIEETRRVARQRNLSPDRFEFQMLYGVRTDLQKRVVAEGNRLRIYVPFGQEWFPYFMRRMAERPANAWFALRGILGR
jgi:proline dehydrogenase